MTIDPRIISLQQLVPEVLSNYRASATVKTIALSADVKKEFSIAVADPIRIKQVLSNLIDNALKFTPAGGTISIKTQALDREPGMVCVCRSRTRVVASVPTPEQKFSIAYTRRRLFLPRTEKGWGLGLYLCHELISHHGGRIWVDSELGKGSTFFFTLPAFSLHNVVMRFIDENQDFLGTLAIICLDVVADGRVHSSEIGKAVWAEKWDRLNHVRLPVGTILLPRMSLIGQPERFFLLTSNRQETADQIAGRIENQIGGHRRKDDSKYDSSRYSGSSGSCQSRSETRNTLRVYSRPWWLGLGLGAEILRFTDQQQRLAAQDAITIMMSLNRQKPNRNQTRSDGNRREKEMLSD